MARARPSSVQPCRSRRARSTCQDCRPNWRARSFEDPRAPASFAMVRIFMANAATIGTGSDPEASACRSNPSASPARPAMAASATANAVTSDATLVVAVDDLLGDVAVGVGDELPAGGGELGEVVGEGGDEGAHRARGGLALRGAELRGGEVDLVALALELGAHHLDAASRCPRGWRRAASCRAPLRRGAAPARCRRRAPRGRRASPRGTRRWPSRPGSPG